MDLLKKLLWPIKNLQIFYEPSLYPPPPCSRYFMTRPLNGKILLVFVHCSKDFSKDRAGETGGGGGVGCHVPPTFLQSKTNLGRSTIICNISLCK